MTFFITTDLGVLGIENQPLASSCVKLAPSLVISALATPSSGFIKPYFSRFSFERNTMRSIIARRGPREAMRTQPWPYERCAAWWSSQQCPPPNVCNCAASIDTCPNSLSFYLLENPCTSFHTLIGCHGLVFRFPARSCYSWGTSCGASLISDHVYVRQGNR